jgi:hypothetical protein
MQSNMICYDSPSFSRSLPFLEGGDPNVRFGELAAAPTVDDGSRRVILVGLKGRWELRIGLPGSDVLRGGVVNDGVSPEAASVRRNSTHNREKDY